MTTLTAIRDKHTYVGMTRERFAEILRWNRAHELTNDQQIRNMNVALESYARAKHLSDRANELWNLYDKASNDKFGSQEEAIIIYEQHQELVGPTPRKRTQEERYSRDWEFIVW